MILHNFSSFSLINNLSINQSNFPFNLLYLLIKSLVFIVGILGQHILLIYHFIHFIQVIQIFLNNLLFLHLFYSQSQSPSILLLILLLFLLHLLLSKRYRSTFILRTLFSYNRRLHFFLRNFQIFLGILPIETFLRIIIRILGIVPGSIFRILLSVRLSIIKASLLRSVFIRH